MKTLAVCGLFALGAFALNLPLEVMNWADVVRAGEPVTAGVPVPQGAIYDLSSLRITDGSGNTMPAQFKVLSRWWNETAKGIAVPSAKWILCDFQAASVPASGKAAFSIRDDNGNIAPTTAVSTINSSDKITVNTGPLSFTISKLHFNLFDELQLNGQPIIASSPQNGGSVTAGEWAAGECITGTVHTTTQSAPDSVVIEENGPMKVVIRVEGRHNAATNGVSKGLYGYQVYITAYAGKSFVDVQFALTNTYLDGQAPAAVTAFAWPIKSWLLDINLASTTGTWDWVLPDSNGSSGILDAGGTRLFQNKAGFQVNGAPAGIAARGAGGLSNGTIGVRFSIRDFAVRAPKAFHLRPGRLTFEFLPDTGGVYSLDPSSRLNNRMRLEFFSEAVSVDPVRAFMKKADAPLRMLAPQGWYRNTKSWYRGFGVSPHASCTRTAPASWTRMAKSSPVEWENYGFFGGFNGVGDHVNLTSCFWAYLQTGNPADFEQAESWTFHFNDIVPLQTASTRWSDFEYMLSPESHLPGYSCTDPEFGYSTALSTFPGWTRHRGDLPDAGHMPNLQVLEYYLLTGDPATREAVESQAIRAGGQIYNRVYANPYGPWVSNPANRSRVVVLDSLYFMSYGPRYVGRPVIVAGQGYEISGQPLLKRPMELYSYSIRNWIRRSPIGYLGVTADGGVADVWTANHPNVPVPTSMWMTDFQIGIATEAIYYYWQLTGDPQVHDAVIHSGKSFEWRAAKDSTGYKGFIYGGWADYLCEGKRYSSGSFESSANEGFGGLIFGYLASGRSDLFEVVKTMRPWYETNDFRSLDLKSANFWEAVYRNDSLDHTPPAAVRDLSATPLAGGNVRLSWTAPGGDSLTGRAAYYRIKFSTAPIVDFAQRWDYETGRGWPDLRDPLPYSDSAWTAKADGYRNLEETPFWAATQADSAPTPAAAGLPETFTLAGFTDTRPWFFSITAFDSAGNVSGVSNCAMNAPALVSAAYRCRDTIEAELSTVIRPVLTLSNSQVDSSGLAVYFRSLDPQVARVLWDGRVTGKTSGLARIEVTRGTLPIDTFTLTVAPSTAGVDSIILSRDSLPFCVRDTFLLYSMRTYFSHDGEQFMKMLLPNSQFTWTSSNPAVADVRDGYVSGKTAGTATIYAEMAGVKDSVFFTVRPRPAFLKRFNFGCDTLPSSFGWLGGGVPFDAGRGYGWTYGSGECRVDRGGGFLLGTFVSGNNIGFKVVAPAGGYIVRIAMGDNGYPPSTVIHWANIGPDTLVRHAIVPNSGNTIKDDTITITGDSGVTFNVYGPICYMVMISNEGIDINSVADDNGVKVLLAPPGVDAEKAPETVARMELDAYPNPFNPTVTVHVALLPRTQALYRIYNMKGQLLFQQALSSGPFGMRRAFAWDGRDLKGRVAPSGFYIGQLIANTNKRMTHKLMLLK